MRNYYQDYKNLHDSIKPIRGRAEEVRPIGERRRDHECIEMDGDVVACRLYNTQVVRYYPDGRIGVGCDSWQSPLTAEFIHTHSPWQCFKRNNKLWVMVPNGDQKYMHYPIPSKGELQFQVVERNGMRYWEPVGDVVIEKQVVNRERAKAARAPYKPFLNWAKTFLKMSDGWIMHATRKEALGMDKCGFHYSFVQAEIIELMKNEEGYLKALCFMLGARGDAKEWQVAEVVEEKHYGGAHTYKETYYDMKFEFNRLRARVYRMVDANSCIHDKVQVPVTTRTQSGIV